MVKKRPRLYLPLVTIDSIGAVGAIDTVDAIGEGLLFEALTIERSAASS